MIVQCPRCAKRYRLDEEKASAGAVEVRCSECGHVFSPAPAGDDPGCRAAAAGERSGKKRVLVCDDAPFFRTMLSDILTEAGFEVGTASSGEETLSRISSFLPDLLVIDLQMPGMGGFETIRAIRRDATRAHLPILAVSAVYTDSSDMIELQDAGADDYIGKKFKPDHLVKRVQRLLTPPPGGE